MITYFEKAIDNILVSWYNRTVGKGNKCLSMHRIVDFFGSTEISNGMVLIPVEGVVLCEGVRK